MPVPHSGAGIVVKGGGKRPATLPKWQLHGPLGDAGGPLGAVPQECAEAVTVDQGAAGHSDQLQLSSSS